MIFLAAVKMKDSLTSGTNAKFRKVFKWEIVTVRKKTYSIKQRLRESV